MFARAVAAGCALAVFAGAADARPQPVKHYCSGEIHARGNAYGFQGTGVSCRFMRRATARWLRENRPPRHWHCLDLGDGGDCHSLRNAAKFQYYAMD